MCGEPSGVVLALVRIGTVHIAGCPQEAEEARDGQGVPHMKKLLRPKVVIPIIVSASIVAALLAFADVKKVMALLLGFQSQYLLYFILLMLAYEVVRAAQWHYLLTTLDIRVPLRTQLFTYLGGEMAKSLPVGNYFSSYLLSETKGAKLGRASAATTIIILIEVAVS